MSSYIVVVPSHTACNTDKHANYSHVTDLAHISRDQLNRGNISNNFK